MEIIDALELSWTNGRDLIDNLNPAQLATPTRCAGWTVRDLLNHTLGECAMATAVNRGEPSVPAHPDVIGDGTDLPQLWTKVGNDNVKSWRESGLAGERTYFYGTFPAAVCALINLGEVVVHSWDLAVATGNDTAIDPELAQLVYGVYSAFPLDGMRSAGQLGPELPVAAEAAVDQRLLGLLGRSAP